MSSGASLSWIREHYGVPAYRMRPITFLGRKGYITGSSGPHLLARVEGYGERPVVLHPTWGVEYPPVSSVGQEDQSEQ